MTFCGTKDVIYVVIYVHIYVVIYVHIYVVIYVHKSLIGPPFTYTARCPQFGVMGTSNE